MRILKVRFKNLNSLVGEWEIDLTHHAYTADGIFAITGPTGAGKTTLLDAICLALYGRTPRLSKVTKNANEIMSRQSGECYAEATFETQSGRYRCHWSQHRSRRKPGGELQAPKHEIADADSGKILETKIVEVAKQIERVTGMDFDRFTRSMLLAQGGFAVFLQAGPGERAPILEQITGTEIYSQISIRVHERRAEERKKFDALQAGLAGLQLLSPEDEQQLNVSMKQKSGQDTEINKQLEQKNQAIVWLEGIARLEQELKQVGQQKDGLQTRIDAFASEQDKLTRAIHAHELAGDYAALTSMRREQDNDKLNHGECQESVPALEESSKQAIEAMNKAVVQLDTSKDEQQKAVPVIRKVRELDLKVQEKDKSIRAVSDSISAGDKTLEALRTKHNESRADLDGKKSALDGLLQQLEETKADEGLVEHLAGICGRFDALQNLHVQLNAKLEEFKQTDGQVREVTLLWRQQTENLETKKRSLNNSRNVLAQKHLELASVLENSELSDWRNGLASLNAQQTLLVRASEAALSITQSRKSFDELGKLQETLVSDNAGLTEQLIIQIEQQAALDKEMGHLETQFSLLKKIEDLEQARHQLQDGEPCPLCGARDHPYAAGNIPAADETKLQLDKVRGDLKLATAAVSDLKVKQARLIKDQEQVAAKQKEQAENIEESKKLLIRFCASLPLEADDPGLGVKVDGLRHENDAAIDHASKIVHAAEEAEKQINKLHRSLELVKESVVKAERETQTAEHNKDSAGQLLERLKKETEDFQIQQEKFLGLLRKEVQVFGIETLSIDLLDQVQAKLAGRRQQWLSRQQDKSDLERMIDALETQSNHQIVQIQKSVVELSKQRELQEGMLREQEAMTRERREIFGNKNPSDEELRLTAAINFTEKALETARHNQNIADQELSRLKSMIEALEKSIAGRGAQLCSAEAAFLVQLKGLEFVDENHYKIACLPDYERKALAGQSQKLADEKTELTAQEREKSKLLESERQKQVTDEPQDNLKEALTMLIAKQKELLQEIGAIQQKLKDNEALKQKMQESALVIDAQKGECSRWDQLHELIGSADGKKFRNFAQGLTFAMMIGHANRQLQKMTDRYLLIRDQSQPLELNVIDNYQAGEVRTTKNLSGGESFIVSLSLALGLSQMASKNVRVDSLFLDEGFGTLDEEALDTALETLAGLQQDGKLIGVISHVSALKERISTQIQITPQTGGRSFITGPGCGKSNPNLF